MARYKSHPAQIAAETRYQAAAKALKAIDGVGSGNMGLTPDSVKSSPEYRLAKGRLDRAFQDLRRVNAKVVKLRKQSA